MGNELILDSDRQRRTGAALREALRQVAREHERVLSPASVTTALIDVAQETMSAHTQRENPYASGIEVMLRSFSAILNLDAEPELTAGYIGNKFSNGFWGLMHAFREYHPGILDTFDGGLKNVLSMSGFKGAS